MCSIQILEIWCVYNSSWRLIQFVSCGTQEAVGQDQVVGVVEGWEEVEDRTASQRRKRSQQKKQKKHPLSETVCVSVY